MEEERGCATLFTANCLEWRSVSSEYVHEQSCSNSDSDAHGTRLGSCISFTRERMQFKIGSRKTIDLIRTAAESNHGSTPKAMYESGREAFEWGR